MGTLALPSANDIRKYATGALVAAGARDVTPAPLDDIAQAAGLLLPEALYEMGDDIPPTIRSIIKKFKGRVLGLLATNERTIYIDRFESPTRQRFVYGHEIGHRVLRWHERAYMVDDYHTLGATTELLEQEANAFSSDVLFGIDRFTLQADSFAPGIAVPLSMADEYAASRHATLRRYVEFSERPLGLLVLGKYEVLLDGKRALKVITNQCVQSVRFEERYGAIADIVPRRLSLEEFPVAAEAAEMHCSNSETMTMRLSNTKKGIVDFDAEIVDNGRLRFVLLFQRHFGQGRRLRLAT